MARDISDSTPPLKSYCRVDAGGVPAEWVEATVATPDQPTFVCFLGDVDGMAALENHRAVAWRLAVTTGGRVLTVTCRSEVSRSDCAAVEAGVTAYVWLLGEGTDSQLTSFAGAAHDGWLVNGIHRAVLQRGLSPPTGEMRVARWSESPWVHRKLRSRKEMRACPDVGSTPRRLATGR